MQDLPNEENMCCWSEEKAPNLQLAAMREGEWNELDLFKHLHKTNKSNSFPRFDLKLELHFLWPISQGKLKISNAITSRKNVCLTRKDNLIFCCCRNRECEKINGARHSKITLQHTKNSLN